jgi:hypothetical protein
MSAKIGVTPPGYLDQNYLNEGAQYAMQWSYAALIAGYRDQSEKTVQSFAQLKNPETGEQLGRTQRNRNKSMIGVVHYMDPSFNRWMAMQPLETQKKVAQEILCSLMTLQDMELAMVVKARSGAGGVKQERGHLLGHHAVHATSREGEMRWHVHSNYARWVSREGDWKAVSGNFRGAFKAIKDTGARFQMRVAHLMEKEMGVAMGIDPDNGQAFVKGLERTHPQHRKDAAVKYLKDRNLKVTPVSVTYAMQNTRPKKRAVNAEKLAEKAKEELKADLTVLEKPKTPSIWEKVVKDLVGEPLNVIRAAWVASRPPKKEKNQKPEDVVVMVHDVKKFMKDVNKTPLGECHRAAVREVRNTLCFSFDHALKVAQLGFRRARRPKLYLKKGTVIKISKDVKMTERERWELERLAYRKKCRIEYEKTQEREKGR